MQKVIVVGAGISGVTSAIEFKKRGHKVTLVDPGPLPHPLAASTDISKAVRAAYGPDAGYVESGRVVATLVEHAKSIGVELHERAKFVALDENDHCVSGIVLEDRDRISGDAVVIAAGAWTPYVLPFTKKFFRATGHPVFHL